MRCFHLASYLLDFHLPLPCSRRSPQQLWISFEFGSGLYIIFRKFTNALHYLLNTLRSHTTYTYTLAEGYQFISGSHLILFCWYLSYVDIRGNEETDAAAKQVARCTDSPPPPSPPTSNTFPNSNLVTLLFAFNENRVTFQHIPFISCRYKEIYQASKSANVEKLCRVVFSWATTASPMATL